MLMLLSCATRQGTGLERRQYPLARFEMPQHPGNGAGVEQIGVVL